MGTIRKVDVDEVKSLNINLTFTERKLCVKPFSSSDKTVINNVNIAIQLFKNPKVF